jgi:hypothetical protein
MTIVMTCAGSLGHWVYPKNIDEGEERPEALIRVARKPLVQWAVESVGSWREPVEYVFITLARHEDQHDLTGALRGFMRNRFRVQTIQKRGHGQLATAIVASALFSNPSPVLVSSCNVFVVSDLREHVERIEPDCRSVMVTRATDSAADFLEPWQHELRALTHSASDEASTGVPAGIYYFRDGREFAEAGAAAVLAASYRSQPCLMTDAVEIYEKRGWKIERRAAIESWQLKNPLTARAFERRMASAMPESRLG